MFDISFRILWVFYITKKVVQAPKARHKMLWELGTSHGLPTAEVTTKISKNKTCCPTRCCCYSNFL